MAKGSIRASFMGVILCHHAFLFASGPENTHEFHQTWLHSTLSLQFYPVVVFLFSLDLPDPFKLHASSRSEQPTCPNDWGQPFFPLFSALSRGPSPFPICPQRESTWPPRTPPRAMHPALPLSLSPIHSLKDDSMLPVVSFSPPHRPIKRSKTRIGANVFALSTHILTISGVS